MNSLFQRQLLNTHFIKKQLLNPFLFSTKGPEGNRVLVESSDNNLQFNDGDETNLDNDEIEQDSSEDENQEDRENPMSNSEDQDDDSENAEKDALATGKGTFNAYLICYWGEGGGAKYGPLLFFLHHPKGLR